MPSHVFLLAWAYGTAGTVFTTCLPACTDVNRSVTGPSNLSVHKLLWLVLWCVRVAAVSCLAHSITVYSTNLTGRLLYAALQTEQHRYRAYESADFLIVHRISLFEYQVYLSVADSVVEACVAYQAASL